MSQSALGSQITFTGKQELMTTAPALTVKAFHHLKMFTTVMKTMVAMWGRI